MFDDQGDSFIVTRFINPNHFYLYDPTRKNDKLLHDLETRISEEIAISRKLHPEVHEKYENNIKKGDLVGYYWGEGKRYIRCEVDGLREGAGVKTYFLFSIDYGVSLYTTNFDSIDPISEFYKFTHTQIIGPLALEVTPIVISYDFVKDKRFPIFHRRWSDPAVELAAKQIKDAVSIKFIPSRTKTKLYRGFGFGDLMLTLPSGRQQSLTKSLIEMKFGSNEQTDHEFYGRFESSNTFWIERWNDNSRNGGILRTPGDTIPVLYELELEKMKKRLMFAMEKEKRRQQLAMEASAKSMQASIEKVLDWKERIKGFETVAPDLFEGNKADDEGIVNDVTEMPDLGDDTISEVEPFISVSRISIVNIAKVDETWN